MASTMPRSETVATWSTPRRMWSKVDWLSEARRPSAMVSTSVSGISRPAANERAASSAPAGSAPTTRAGGPQRLHCGRDAADQAAAADRRQDDVEAGCVLHELQRRGALAGHHGGIVERVDHRRAGLGHDARRGFLAGGQRRRAEGDPAAQPLHLQHLRPRRALRHHDIGWDAAQPRRPRHRRRMVAGRVGGDAAGGRRVRERQHRVGRAARLEGADVLQVLALEEQPRRRPPRPAGRWSAPACGVRAARCGRGRPRCRRG